jgi:hypothetical protein
MITVISYPSNFLNYSFNEGTSINSNEIVKNIIVNVSDAGADEFIEIDFNGVITTLILTEECRYTPIDIVFLNKEGEAQTLTFFKAKTDSLSTTKEEFESDRGQPIDGFHQFNTFNIQGKSKFKVNSGFVKEQMNETFKELFLSSKMYSYINGNLTPLKITSSSLEFKTRAKDRLINYEVEFENAFNEINNI